MVLLKELDRIQDRPCKGRDDLRHVGVQQREQQPRVAGIDGLGREEQFDRTGHHALLEPLGIGALGQLHADHTQSRADDGVKPGLIHVFHFLRQALQQREGGRTVEQDVAHAGGIGNQVPGGIGDALLTGGRTGAQGVANQGLGAKDVGFADAGGQLDQRGVEIVFRQRNTLCKRFIGMDQIEAVVLTDIRSFIASEDFPQEIDALIDFLAAAILNEKCPCHLHHSVCLLLIVKLGVTLHGRELIDERSEFSLPTRNQFLRKTRNAQHSGAAGSCGPHNIGNIQPGLNRHFNPMIKIIDAAYNSLWCVIHGLCQRSGIHEISVSDTLRQDNGRVHVFHAVQIKGYILADFDLIAEGDIVVPEQIDTVHLVYGSVPWIQIFCQIRAVPVQDDKRFGLVQQKLQPHLLDKLESFGSYDGFFPEGTDIPMVFLHRFQQRFQSVGKQKIVCVQEENIFPAHMLHAFISGTGRGMIVIV